MGALEATLIAQLTRKLVRMLVMMKSQVSLNLGHLGSKTRSIGQIEYLVGTLEVTFLAIGQNVSLCNRG